MAFTPGPEKNLCRAICFASTPRTALHSTEITGSAGLFRAADGSPQWLGGASPYQHFDYEIIARSTGETDRRRNQRPAGGGACHRHVEDVGGESGRARAGGKLTRS